MNSEINLANEKILNSKANFDRYLSEIEETEQRIALLKEEKLGKQEKKTNLFANKEKFTSELAIKEEELSKLSEKLSVKAAEIEEKKKKRGREHRYKI